MKKKNILITLFALILLLSVVAVTYAYYIGGANNDNAQTANLTTGTMSLTFADNDNGFGGAIEFGQTITKKFTIQNTGTLEASASMNWVNLTNTYLYGSLVYTLEYSETLNGVYKTIVKSTNVPKSDSSTTKILAPKVTVPAGKTYYYNLKVTLVDSETINQTTDLNASFFTQFSIEKIDQLEESRDTLAALNLTYNNDDINTRNVSPLPFYTDDGFSKSEVYNLTIEDIDPYYVYADTYTLDISTGKYSLVNPKIGKYAEIYEELKNKYIADIYGKSNNALGNYSYLDAVYKLDSKSTAEKIYYFESSKTGVFNESDIYSTEDDYGISYYYRGNVKDNYVNFAGFFWRIIRINGDGSVRLLYDGTVAHENIDQSEDRFIGKSGYNNKNNSPADVGYMYGDITSSNYDELHANTNDSTIKTYLDDWYVKNIENKGFASYISDEIFCNDRSLSPNNSDYFGTYYRIFDIIPSIPNLVCPQKHDAFTVSDTTKGNGDLSKPIGLMTADEAHFAGSMAAGRVSSQQFNYSSYITKKHKYWLLSPYYYNSSATHTMKSEYIQISSTSDVSSNYYVDPVINLSNETAKSLIGTGTMEDPYRIS